jgi:hypothetical protein
VVAVEDQGRDLERRVAERLDEVRYELGELRRTLEAMSEADAEALELIGRLLRATEARVDALEDHERRNGQGHALPAPEVPSV